MSEHEENVVQNELYYKLIDSYYRPEKLTIEKLRKYKGCENIDDAEAQEIIDGLYHLSIVIFRNFKKN